MIELVERIRYNNEKNKAEEGIGIGYTPYNVALYMVEELLRDVEYSTDLKILDPAAGNGIFIAALIRVIHEKYNIDYKTIIENNIYAIERDYETYQNLIGMMLDHFNIDINKLNFYCEDTLQGFHKTKLRFDLIIGNPPFISLTGVKTNKKYASFIEHNYKTCSGYYDIYYAFLEGALKILKKDGRLQYILPNSFLYGYNTKNIRAHVRKNYDIEMIVDFGKNRVFGDKFVCAAIVQIRNREETDSIYLKEVSLDKFDKMRELDFILYEKLNLDIEDALFFRNRKEIDFVQKCEDTFDLKLSDIMAPTIATLCDKIFVVEKDDLGYYLKNLDEKKYIESDIIRPFVKIGRWEEKYVIFPYKDVDGVITILEEDEFKTKYPKAYNYLLENKDLLDKRDGGRKNSVAWYAYGRSQGLKNFGKAILLPHSSKINKFHYNNDPIALYGNGSIVKLPNEDEYSYGLTLKILESKFFMEYLKLTTGIIKGGSYRLNKRHIGGFSIPKIKLCSKRLELLRLEGEEFETALLKLYGIIGEDDMIYG